LEPRRRDFTFDTGDVPGEQKIMSDYQLSDILDKQILKSSMFMILLICGHSL
jgi:hypothetical protein